MSTRERDKLLWYLTVAAGAGFILAAIASCTQARDDRERRLAEAGQPAGHAVYGEDLRREMAELNRLTAGDLRETIYTGSEPQRDLRRVAKAAASMAETAGRIPDAVGKVQLSEEERRGFLRLAEQLRHEALELNRQARDDDFTGAKAAMDRVTDTCNACHSTFRFSPIDPAG